MTWTRAGLRSPGHSEGGTVAMLAAAREKKIGSLVLMATSGITGADLMLEQQRASARSC